MCIDFSLLRFRNTELSEGPLDNACKSFYTGQDCQFRPLTVTEVLNRPCILILIQVFHGRHQFITSSTTTDLNYWIKHPFEFSDPIVKPEYL